MRLPFLQGGMKISSGGYFCVTLRCPLYEVGIVFANSWGVPMII
ncbi:hypothetical protein [Rubritalea tangerina]